MRGTIGMGTCVGISETEVLTSAAVPEATPELAAVARVLEPPATFEATAASSDAADWALVAT